MVNVAGKRKISETIDGEVSLLTPTINQYEWDELVRFIPAAMRATGGPSRWKRDDVIVETARYLGFQRTGSRIHDVLKKAITRALREGVLERARRQVR